MDRNAVAQSPLPENEKGRRTDAAPRAPAKGHSRTAWPTPLSGRGPEAASTVQEPKLKLAGFSEAVGRSRVVQVVVMPAISPRSILVRYSGWSLSYSIITGSVGHNPPLRAGDGWRSSPLGNRQ